MVGRKALLQRIVDIARGDDDIAFAGHDALAARRRDRVALALFRLNERERRLTIAFRALFDNVG